MATSAQELRASGDAALLRGIGFWALAASVINNTVGGSIFILPSSLAKTMGPAAPLAFVLGALFFIPIALCFSAAGSRIQATGGAYSYVTAAFGQLPGFVIAAVLWISNVASDGGIAAALSDQTRQISPFFSQPLVRDGIIVTVFTALVVINIRGVRSGAQAVMGFAIAKLLPLLVLATVGWVYVHPSNLHVASVPGSATIGESMVLVIYAYSGMETALLPSGEVSDPSKVVPRATMTAIALVVALYVGLQAVAQGVLGEALKTSTAPLASTAGVIAPVLFGALILTAAVSQCGNLHNELLGSSRLLYAMGRDGYLPSPFAWITATHRVPAVAIVVHAAIACTLAVLGGFEGLALVAGGTVCMVYLSVCAAAWRLQRRSVRAEGTPFHLPGGPLIPVIGALGMALVLYTLERKEWLAIGYALLAIMAIYAIMGALRGRSPA